MKHLFKNIDLNNIILIGHSRGGGSVLIKASENSIIKNVISWAGVSDFKTRFRYFLGLNIPFKDSKYYLSTYNEIFLNGASNVFDRNRVYGGLGYKVSDGIKLEIGYMNQIFETSSRDQINLITFINF